MTNFLGFLSLPIFIGLVLLFGSFLKNSGRYLHQRKFKWILAGYFLILLASAVMLPLLPQEGFADQNIVGEDTLQQQRKASRQLFNFAQMGMPDSVEGVMVPEKWAFEYGGEILTITTRGNFYNPIIVERKDQNDGLVEVSYYTTRTIMNRIDVTDLIVPPQITLQQDRLIMEHPKQDAFKLAGFRREFIIAYLTDKPAAPLLMQPDSSPAPMGHQIIYLRIPRDLELTSREYLHFVE